MANAGSVTVEVGANLDRFESGMRQVDSRLRGLGSRASILGRGFGTLGGGIDRATSSLRAITRGASSAILSFVGLRGAVLAASGGFLGGAGLIYAMQKAVGVAINLEEQTNKVGVVFGRSSRMILNWGKTTATGIGLAQTAALEAAGTFGNMLRPLGILPKQAAEMSKALVNLAGDMASFNNARLEDTLIAIRAGLAGEVEPLRRFGVFLSETRLKAQAIASGFVPTGFKGVLDPVVKSLSAYNLILKDTALTQGDYKRTADSTANVLRTIRAQVTDLAGAFGAGLEPIVNRVGISLRDNFASDATKKRVEELGRVVGEKLDRSIRRLVGWFKANWGGIKDGFATARDVLKKLVQIGEQFYRTLQKIGGVTPGGTGTLIGVIVGGALALKLAGILGQLKMIKTQLLFLRATPWVIAISLVLLNRDPIQKWLKSKLGRAYGGGKIDLSTPSGWTNAPDWAREAYVKAGGVPPGGVVQTVRPSRESGGGGVAGVRTSSGAPKPITTAGFLQTGGASAKGGGGVQALLPANLRLGLAQAELTKEINDDIRAEKKIVAWLEQKVRTTRNRERQIDLLSELATHRERLAALKPEEDTRTRMSTLFGGPFLTGDAFSTAASFGYEAKPRDLLRDLKMQNAQLTTLSRSLRRLQRRGAPGALVEELRGMGLEGADEASTLAGAKKGVFRQYVRAFQNRERLEERIQHMDVKSRTVTVNANNVSVHGLRGDAGQQTFRRTSTRRSVRRAGGGSGR